MDFHFSFSSEGEGLIPVAPYSIDACEVLLQSPSFTYAAGLPNAPGDALHRSGQPLKAALPITKFECALLKIAAPNSGARCASRCRVGSRPPGRLQAGGLHEGKCW